MADRPIPVEAPVEAGMPLLLLLLLAAGLTLAALPAPGTGDLHIWAFWGENPLQYGLVEGYARNAHEHPPGMTTLLWLAQHLAIWLGIAPTLAIKLSFLPFLFATTGLLWRWSGQLSAALLCHAVLAYSAIALGYLDIYFAPFLLWACYSLLQGRMGQAVLAFTLACLVKYPPLIIAPLLLCALWRATAGPGSLPRRARLLAVPLLMLGGVMLVFGLEPLRALERAFGHDILSAQALNLNWVFTRLLLAQGVPPMTEAGDQAVYMIAGAHIPATLTWWSRGLFAIGYLGALALVAWRQRDATGLLLGCLLAHFSYFMFAIGAHENHLYLSMLLAMALYCHDRRWWTVAVLLAAISSLNLLAFYGLDGQPLLLWQGVDLHEQTLLPSAMAYPVDIRLLLALFNLACYLLLWVTVLRRQPDAGGTDGGRGVVGVQPAEVDKPA